MPIYEYHCKSCGFEFETIQKISEDPLKDCPECGLVELKKLVSKAAFRLKGGGWYETDFKSGDKKNVHGAESKSDGDSKSAGPKKSDSASDSKPKSDGTSKSDSKSKSGGASSAGSSST
jgi:putative FmdB family regulatory protein